MPAGITVGKWAACPSHWTSWSSGLPNYPASHLADCSKCLASWLASHLGSQLPVQKFLRHALRGLKTIIRFCAIKLRGKEKFSLFPKRKTEIKKIENCQQNKNCTSITSLVFTAVSVQRKGTTMATLLELANLKDYISHSSFSSLFRLFFLHLKEKKQKGFKKSL